MGLSLFKRCVVRDRRIKERFLTLILSEVRREREGEFIDRNPIRKVLEMLVDVGGDSTKVYTKDFESAFLADTAAFYKAESNNYITNNSCSSFLRKVRTRLNEEFERCLNYLNAETERELQRVVMNEYVGEHAATLISMENSGLRWLIQNDKLDDIGLMYHLFQQEPKAF